MPREPNRSLSSALEVETGNTSLRGLEGSEDDKLKAQAFKTRGKRQKIEEAGQKKGLIEPGSLSSLRGRGKSQQGTGREETGSWLRAGSGATKLPVELCAGSLTSSI